MNAIEANALSKSYGDVVAVEQISFHVRESEVFGLLGPNGAGKTTTIRMLTGLTRPDGGGARLLGHDVVCDSARAKKQIGVVPEESNLYDELSAFDNVVFVGQLYGVPRRERAPRAEELLRAFGLWERRNARFRTLSKGMKRNLTIAAALVHRPRVLFLDEPTSGLDVVHARGLRRMVAELRSQGVTVFLTTHYIEEADQLCDRVALLVRGKVVQLGAPQELKSLAEEEQVVLVRFQEGHEVERKALAGLPGVEASSASGQDVRLIVSDVTAAVAGLCDLAQRRGARIAAINTAQPSLEDAFVKLTGLSVEVMLAEKGRP